LFANLYLLLLVVAATAPVDNLDFVPLRKAGRSCSRKDDVACQVGSATFTGTRSYGPTKRLFGECYNNAVCPYRQAIVFLGTTTGNPVWERQWYVRAKRTLDNCSRRKSDLREMTRYHYYKHLLIERQRSHFACRRRERRQRWQQRRLELRRRRARRFLGTVALRNAPTPKRTEVLDIEP